MNIEIFSVQSENFSVHHFVQCTVQSEKFKVYLGSTNNVVLYEWHLVGIAQYQFSQRLNANMPALKNVLIARKQSQPLMGQEVYVLQRVVMILL